MSRRARRIKIRIVAEGRRIWIPSLPFWLIITGWKIAAAFSRDSAIRNLDISAVLKELSACGRFVLADISVEEDKTKVFIEII